MTLRSITLPDPLPFSRAGYADTLAAHARLLESHAARLHAAALERLKTQEDLDLVDHYVGCVFGPDTREERSDLVHRETAVANWRTYRGIAAALLAMPARMTLQVVVTAGSAISLHTMRLDMQRLTLEGPVVVVEPRVQRHRVSGLGPVLATRWVEPSGEARYGWTAVPPEPATPAEACDRLVARYEERARRGITQSLEEGVAPNAAVIRSDSLGDQVTIIGGNLLFVLLGSYPAIVQAAQTPPSMRHAPLIGETSGHARLRWIDLDAPGPAPADPAELVEAFEWPAELADLEDEEPASARQDERWTDFPRTGRQLSDAELWREIQLDACFGEIDVRLAAMSPAELDAVIADAGFDAALEHARGYGLREKVLEAIWKKAAGEEEE